MSNKNKKSFHKGRIGDRFRTVEINNDNLKRKNKREYKKIAILVMFLLISVIGTSYGLFKVLIDNTSEHEVVAGTFKVEFEEGNEIHLTNLAPMSDSEGMSTDGYHFTIKNTGTIDAKYHVSLEETPASSNTLDRKYINYSIKLSDGSWTSPRSLADGLLLNSGSLSAESGKDEVDYELKMWLREDADNSVQGKTYAARIVVSAVQSNGAANDLVAPVINIPNTSIHISLNDSFTDPVPYEIKDSSGQSIDISNVTKTYEYYDGVNTMTVDNVDPSKLGIYYIYYRVSDKNGNIGCTVVSVSVNPTSDDHIPTIDLVGESNLELKKGETYQDLGASAEDIEDGVLTDKIITVGTVNSFVEGVYTVKYIVIDSKGNTNSVVRVVHIIPKGSIEITTETITRKDNKYYIPVHIMAKEGNIGGYYLSNHNKMPTTSNYTKLEEVTNQYDKEFVVPSSGTYYLWVYDTNHNVVSKKIEVKKIGDISSSDDEINLKVGQSKKADISNNTGTLSYASSNSGIATVDKNGVIQGVSVGTTTITVTDTATSSMIDITVNVYKEVTVTFSANGSQLDSTTKSCEIWGEATSCEISSPSIEREGYKILGFSQNENDTSGSWDINTKKMISDNSTYYAITSKDISIKVYYNNNGNVESITENKTIYNQNKGTYRASDEVVNSIGLRGLPYKGISSKLNNMETEDIYTNITNNQVYYAVYTGNIDTKFYYYNDGQRFIFSTNKVNSVLINEDSATYHINEEEVSVPEEVLLSQGGDDRTYYGLSTRPFDYRHIESSITTKNEVYYAVYKGKWEVSYTNDDESVKSIGSTSDQCDNYQIMDGDRYTVEGHNCTKTLPDIISRDHYASGQWYDHDTVIGNPNDEYTIHGNKELIARAKEKKYVIKYDCTTTGGSCNIPDKTLRYGDIVDLDEVAKKSGYDFLGWHTNKDSSSGFTSPPTVTGNMTLYAIFKRSESISLNSKIEEYTGREIEANDAKVSEGVDSSQLSYQYYSDTNCSNELSSVPIDAGNYSVKAVLEGKEGSLPLQSSCVAHTITPKRVNITWDEATEFSYNGERQAPDYEYSLNDRIENEALELIQSKAVDVGSYVSEVSIASVIGGRGRIENYTLDNNRKAYDIIRAQGYIDLSSNERIIDQGQDSDSFMIVDSHGGETSVVEVTETDAEVTLDDKTVTISNLSNLAIGTVITIRVTCLATNNYSTATKEYTITIKKPEIGSSDAVARIEKVYYKSLEEALAAAKESGDTIVMLKDTIESVENVKDITLDLNGKTVTGVNDSTIINNGTLTILNNGTIKNTTNTAIVNHSILTLGENDGDVLKDNPCIEGTTKGIEQQGIMNFYDGLITAELGLDGYVYNKPEGYEVFTDHDYSNGYQKIYLEETSSILTRAVAKTVNYSSEDSNEIISTNYYFNLQDAIDFITDMNTDFEKNRTIYAIRDFEAAYPLDLAQNKEVIIDVSGYTVETGYDVTNSGNLKLIDSSVIKGILKISKTITNKSTATLSLDGITISQTTNTNTIDSSGYLNIIRSNVNATGGYGLNINAGELTIDNNSHINSISGDALYISSSDKFILDGGYFQSTGSYAIKMSPDANVEIVDVNITTGKNGIYTSGTIIIDNANIDVQNYSINGKGNLVIKNGTYKGRYCISNNSGILNVIEGNYESVSTALTSNGRVNIGDANDKSKLPSIISKYNGITVNGGTLDIYNGEISGSEGIFVSSSASATINIYQGTITGQSGDGIIMNNGNLNVYGGKIVGKTYGIETKNNANLVLGNKDDEVSTKSPEVIGEQYGLYSGGNGTISFYDGILKGTTAGHAGVITTLLDGYGIETGEETVDGILYSTSYLGKMTNFLKVGDEEYNTFKKALDAIDTEGTIEVIESVSIAEEVLIPNGKEITIDLGGKQLVNSKMITNEGKLRILDSSVEATGSYTNTSVVSGEYAIKSTNDLTVNSGTIKTTERASVIYLSGKGKITGGTYSAANGARVLYIATDIDITGGSYSSYSKNDTTISIATGKTVNITGVEIDRGGVTASNNANVTIENSNIYRVNPSAHERANITIKSGSYGSISSYGNTVIGDPEDATKVPNISNRITVNGGTLDIYNGEISGSEGIFVSSSASATINIYQGTITGQSGDGIIMNNGNLNVYGGKIVGKTYGIETKNNANLVLGNKDDEVSTKSPEVIGEQYGLYSGGNGTISFYDGALSGQIAGYYGAISKIPNDYVIDDDTQIIDEVMYHRNTLKATEYFVQNGEMQYKSLKTAVLESQNGDTLTIIKDSKVFEEVNTAGKNITLDLNGHHLRLNQAIMNEGTLSIRDNADQGKLSISTNSIIISNKGNLVLEDILLENLTTNYYLITNFANASIEANGTSFKGYSGIHNYAGANLVANDITLDVISSGIYNYSNCKISNSTLNKSDKKTGGYLFYNQTSEDHEALLRNNTYRVSGYYFGYRDIVNNSGELTIQGGTMYSTIDNNNQNAILNLLNTNIIYSYRTSDSDPIIRHRKGQLNIEGGSISSDGDITQYVGIVLSSDASIKNVAITSNTTVNSADATAIVINDNSNINIENTDFNIENFTSNYGISTQAAANLTLKNTNIYLRENTNVFSGRNITSAGIYSSNSDSNIKLESGRIDVHGRMAYGIYIDSGTVIMGIKDGSGTNYANVSIENPLIQATATVTGIGVIKGNGIFKYYDGRIIGSTNAKPETTTEVEPGYEVRFYTDEETGYEYCILEFME